MTTWTLNRIVGGVVAASGSLGDDWGFADPVLEEVSQGVSTFTVQAPGSLDDAWKFNAGDYAQLVRTDESGSEVWFVGMALPNTKSGQPTNESRSYQFVDPFWQMDKTVFRQRWNGLLLPGTVASATGGYYTGHLILNTNESGASVGVYEQLDAVLLYATAPTGYSASAGVNIPFDYEAADLPRMSIWREEVRNITIGEAIRRQLRYLPGSACWFDYSTADLAHGFRPTIHIAKNADLAPVTLKLAADGHESINVQRAWEQELPAVQVVYEQRNSYRNGDVVREFMSIYTDTAPTASGSDFAVGALISNVDLSGITQTSISQKIYTRPFVPDSADTATKNAWWLRHLPSFGDSVPAGFAVNSVGFWHRGASGEPVAGAGATVLPYELSDGVWSSWMPSAGGGTSSCYSIGVSGVVSYQRAASAGGQRENHTMWGEVNVTDVLGGEAGTEYSVVTSNDPGETPPTGVAEFVYSACSGPLWMGSVSYVEQECSGMISVGNRLNLNMVNVSGTASTASPDYDSWRAMNATVQRVRYELQTGRTTIAFGPPKHLGIPDLIELLRMGRYRQRWTNPAVMASGDSSVDATSAGGRVFKEMSNSNTPDASRRTYQRAAAAPGGPIATVSHST